MTMKFQSEGFLLLWAYVFGAGINHRVIHYFHANRAVINCMRASAVGIHTQHIDTVTSVTFYAR